MRCCAWLKGITALEAAGLSALAGILAWQTIKFIPNDRSNPPGKLADAERHFSGGPFDGLKLIGFSSGSGAAAAGR